MRVLEFHPQVAIWQNFYADFIDIRHEPNDQGWVNFSCVLPTHGKVDQGEHGSINVFSGNYRCWHDDCRVQSNLLLGKPDASQVISPAEFLILTQKLDQVSAYSTVESFRLHYSEKELKPVDGDEHRAFTPLTSDLIDFIEASQARISPDLDIVLEYCRSRDLEYQTLVDHHVGYVLDDANPVESLIFPYYVDGRPVAVRARLFNGDKGGIKASTYCLYNLDSCDNPTSDAVMIVEGETDTLRLRQILRQQGLGHIPVVGTPGVNFKLEWARHLAAFRRVIAVPQTDNAAKKFILDLRQAFDERLEIVTLPWGIKETGKDLTDLCRLVDGEARLLKRLRLRDIDRKQKGVLTLDQAIAYADEEPKWVIPDLIEKGTITLAIGEPKTYKTWIALQMIRSISLGTPFLNEDRWTPTPGGSCLLVEEEGSPHRLGQRLSYLFEPDARQAPVNILHRAGIRLDVDESFQTIEDLVLELNPDLLILDPYASLHLQDENTVQGTMTVLKRVQSLFHIKPDLAIVIIHHTPKGGTTARGSGALLGAIDLQIHIAEVADPPNAVKLSFRGRDILDLPESQTYVFDSELKQHKPTAPQARIRVKASAFLSTKSRLKDRLEAIITLLANRPEGLNGKEIAAELNVGYFAIRSDLQQLVGMKKIESRGTNRMTKFFSITDEVVDEE